MRVHEGDGGGKIDSDFSHEMGRLTSGWEQLTPGNGNLGFEGMIGFVTRYPRLCGLYDGVLGPIDVYCR